ncbi:hypothetical protein RHS01_08872 [Rhizoctonia solani]|uniref:Uncharacterized protein n=1 Tax=Rhizoctonia solani TaxID=456999 RepID=A0A8H7I6W1_9AGAM|nr:hypothetical protein RHS01_08872 [Rhizoctonia solani]
MPSRAAPNVPGSRGRPRIYQKKQRSCKLNTNVARRHIQQQETPPSDPEHRHKRPKLTFRTSSRSGNAPQNDFPISSRYNQRKPWGGIFGSEREPGNIKILRREDADRPKRNIPSWLVDTFDALSKKHPVRDATDGHAVTQSMGSDLSDDDNPFAYKAPSPPRAPSTLRFTALPDAVQQEQPRNRRYMNLSSIPFAPPTFVEPTYEDHYQDVIVPLNDFDDKNNNPAHWAGVESSDSKPVPPILRASSQLETPQRMSSSLFSPRAYPFPLIATTPVPHIGPPDDIISHTPTHNNVLEPEADETHDTLCTKHPFGIPMYPAAQLDRSENSLWMP